MEGYAAGKPAASADAGLAVLVSELTGLVGELAGAGPAASSFDEIEQLVMVRGRELLRKVIQHVMDACAAAGPRLAGVADAAGMPRPRAERGHARVMVSQVGPVVVGRMAYRAPGQPNLYPRDAVLNLPPRRYSWCLQRAVVDYVLAGAYEQARRFVAAVTGVVTGKQQLEQITIEAAADAPGSCPALARDRGQGGQGPARPAGPLLISADCKGRGDAARGAAPARRQGPRPAGAELREAARDRGEGPQADGPARVRVRRRPGAPYPGAGHGLRRRQAGAAGAAPLVRRRHRRRPRRDDPRRLRRGRAPRPAP
jgi:hypothetical protein